MDVNQRCCFEDYVKRWLTDKRSRTGICWITLNECAFGVWWKKYHCKMRRKADHCRIVGITTGSILTAVVDVR
jgi:hypothetical protein